MSFELHLAPMELPLIVLLKTQRATKAVDRRVVWKIQTMFVRRFISAVSHLGVLVEAI